MGDLGDPWVAAIADALRDAGETRRLDCPGPLPDRPYDGGPFPRVLVIHRHRLTGIDADQVRGWREAPNGSSMPVMVLCVGPYVRYEALERWSGLVDLVVSEAIATDLLPGRIGRLFAGAERLGPQSEVPAFRIEVAGGDESLCQALADALGAAGYQAEVIDDQVIGGLLRARNRPAALPDRVLTIWEIPVLEPGWADRLEWRARRTGPVIGLAGFADRAIIAQAKAAGAVACLDLPCDIDDLIDVVNRAVRTTAPETWPVPARAEPAHDLPPRPHGRADRPEISAVPAPWSERGPLPRIPLS
jgi:hypothetical protein